MNDFEAELLALINTQWKASDPAKADIDFHRGLKKPEKIVKPQVALQHFGGSQSPLGSKRTELDGRDRETVVVQVKAVNSSVSRIEAAKTTKWKMMKEIDRILRLEELPTSWISAWVEK